MTESECREKARNLDFGINKKSITSYTACAIGKARRKDTEGNMKTVKINEDDARNQKAGSE